MKYGPLLFSVAQWITTSFPIIRIILLILLVLLSLVLIFVVLIQPSNSEGMGALSGQTTDTYYAKNKGKSIEGVMKRLTIVVSVVMAVISVLFFVTLAIYPIGAV